MSEVYVHQDEQETKKKAPYLQFRTNVSLAMLFARNKTDAKLFRSEELEKKCSPPEFRTRTSDEPSPILDERGRRC